MARYRKKPVAVDAFQYTGDREAFSEWINQFDPPPEFWSGIRGNTSHLAIRTLDISRPSLSAANCAISVIMPWPISAAALLITSEPSRCISNTTPACTSYPKR